MAYYDIKSDKIMNCKTNSLTYFHELGHQKLHHKNWFNEMDLQIQILPYFTILICCLSFFIPVSLYLKMLALACIDMWFIWFFFDEIYGWFFAFKNFYVMKRDNKLFGNVK